MMRSAANWMSGGGAGWLCTVISDGYRQHSLPDPSGRVQYKLAAGQPSEIGRHGKALSLVWGILMGISNGWSLYGGSLLRGL